MSGTRTMRGRTPARARAAQAPAISPRERLLLAGAAAAAALALAMPAYARSTAAAPRVHSIRVEAGDTLWELAVECAGPEADPRRTVDLIMVMNGLASPDIAAGSYLLVPADDSRP